MNKPTEAQRRVLQAMAGGAVPQPGAYCCPMTSRAKATHEEGAALKSLLQSGYAYADYSVRGYVFYGPSEAGRAALQQRGVVEGT